MLIENKLVLKKNRFGQMVWMLVKATSTPSQRVRKEYRKALTNLSLEQSSANLLAAEHAHKNLQLPRNQATRVKNIGWFFSVNGQVFFQYSYALKMTGTKKYQPSTKVLWRDANGMWVARSINSDRKGDRVTSYNNFKPHIEKFIEYTLNDILLK